MITPDLIFNSITGIITGCLGIVAFTYKRLIKRVDQVEMDTTRNKIHIEKKTSPEQVKEIINDKVAAIYVTVKRIEEDVKEIKSDLKGRR